MKKVFSLVLALIMVLSLATTAFAVELTIAGEKTGHTYEAYQIFSGDINASGVMTNIVWGNGIKDGAALLAALKADTTEIVNAMDKTQKSSMATEFAAANSAEDIANVMRNWGDDAARIDYFANFLYENGHLAATPTATTTSTTTSYTFADIPAGYYLIKDEDGSIANTEHDFYTKFMVDLTTSTDVAVKGSVPTVDKTVSNTIDGTYTKEISNMLNKTHYYQWTGYVPADIDDYDFYYYKFSDTMSKGLTFQKWEQIYIQHANGNKTWIYDAAQTTATILPEMMPTLNTATAADGTTTITAEWADLLKVYPTLLTSDKIMVTYSAQLNTDAIIGGEGNDNKVELVFSNNPHDENDKGKTPPPETRVYSFKLKVNKVNEKSEPLSGAEFVLYHLHTENTYAEDGVTVTGTKNVEMYAILNTTEADGTIKAEGLQEQVGYYLRETKAPDGYNKLTSDIKIVISGFSTNDTTNVVESISYEVAGKASTATGDQAAAGEISTTVENKSGTTLPSTGGMGTTLFYILGGLMVTGAAVLLITKKRMSV